MLESYDFTIYGDDSLDDEEFHINLEEEEKIFLENFIKAILYKLDKYVTLEKLSYFEEDDHEGEFDDNSLWDIIAYDNDKIIAQITVRERIQYLIEWAHNYDFLKGKGLRFEYKQKDR